MKHLITYICLITTALTPSFMPLYAKSSLDKEIEQLLSHEPILTSRLLKTMDGKWFAIDGDKIKSMLLLRTHLSNMMYGAPLSTGKRKGLYELNGYSHTLIELRQLEKRGDIDTTIAKNLLEDIVKPDYELKMVPFVAMGKDNKDKMVLFIDESLTLHKREKSILRLWAEAKEGEDTKAFKKYVNSFDDMTQFLYDLMNFLDDFIVSCPKACKQYINTLATGIEKKRYAQRFKQMYERQKNKINSYN